MITFNMNIAKTVSTYDEKLQYSQVININDEIHFYNQENESKVYLLNFWLFIQSTDMTKGCCNSCFQT